MLRRLVICVTVVVCGFLMAGVAGQKMLGEGKWTVLNVQPCENDEELPWRLRVRRHKLNRTHDAFDLDMDFAAALDDSCAIRLDICKMMDGGCKPYMTMGDDCLPAFVKKFAKDNVRIALTAGDLDPPDFPIPQGEHHIKNFMLDNEDLPRDGVYGEFGVHAYVVRGGADVACCRAAVRYAPIDDDGPNPTPFG